jgi:hypothetical protein
LDLARALSIPEKMLDCSPRHIYRLADSGRMPVPVRRKVGALALHRPRQLACRREQALIKYQDNNPLLRQPIGFRSGLR